MGVKERVNESYSQWSAAQLARQEWRYAVQSSCTANRLNCEPRRFVSHNHTQHTYTLSINTKQVRLPMNTFGKERKRVTRVKQKEKTLREHRERAMITWFSEQSLTCALKCDRENNYSRRLPRLCKWIRSAMLLHSPFHFHHYYTHTAWRLVTGSKRLSLSTSESQIEIETEAAEKMLITGTLTHTLSTISVAVKSRGSSSNLQKAIN